MKNKDTKFKRSAELEVKLFDEALSGKEVIKDAAIRIQYGHTGSKIRAYCINTKTFLQFPKKLRQLGKLYIADVIEVAKEGYETFYRVAKGTVRDANGKIVW